MNTTAINAVDLVEYMLDVLFYTPAGEVYAGRRGHCASVKIAVRDGFELTADLTLRRVAGKVRLEVWPVPIRRGRDVKKYPLPPELERRAAAILDRESA